ncbi:hypothetical protein [Phreatobacter sp.]|uniref:hypothetical protein n=1 Tax=Phreatobacter sp. TaxID=1966341 RepID=UPI003F6E7AD4
MTRPDWLKPALYGAAGGAAALAIIGFTWGGWVTQSNAGRIAAQQSQTDMVAVLAAICADQARRDPQNADRVTALKAASSWNRGDLVIQNGWATMPGQSTSDRQVANACAVIITS